MSNKNKLFAIFALFVILLTTVNAQFIESLDCDKLFNDSIVLSETEFDELANVCFYGSGFDEDSVDLELKNDDNTYEIEDVEVSNIDPGITSSYIRSQEGTTMTSSIMPAIVRDNTGPP